MASPLSAHEQAVSKIFGGDYVFEIPGFQRPYAWTVEQARDLFDDLWDAAKAQDPGEEFSAYFLGSIVLIKPENTPECQVVDGQQRLTTITLLLSAIRANLTREIENGEDFANAKSALQLSAAEQTNTYKVLSGPLYDTLAARARSAVLLRLDALMSGGGASYDYDTITVEHVLPQNPKADSKWVEWFPDAQKRVDVVHSLGNLALLTRKKNASASNWDFERKKKACFSKGGVSPFVLTTQVLEHADWTPTIVANLP
jgi:hypothetical protein